jgi:hypothetical protein
MAFLEQTLGVNEAGVTGSVANYTFFGATDPAVALYVAKQPVLAQGVDGRYQVAVSVHRQQVKDTVGETSGDAYKTTGGTLALTVAPQPQLSAEAIAQASEVWRAQLPAQDPRFPANPRFVPLNVQKGRARLLLGEGIGKVDVDNNDRDVGGASGNIAFLADLTPLGAYAFQQAIERKSQPPVQLQIDYQYLRWLPPAGAKVTVDGKRVFDHLSGDLSATYNGIYYGGSVTASAVFEELRKVGAIKIELVGELPPEHAKLRDELISTFTKQAQAQLFDAIFKPVAPTVDPAKAGNSGGVFGGINFAMKWQHASEAVSSEFEIVFRGWTWLTGTMDADCMTMFHQLDSSYVNVVDTEQQSIVNVCVSGEEQIKTAACTLSASEGLIPASPVFDNQGGVKPYILTSKTPNDVRVVSSADLVYDQPKFPVLRLRREATIAEGGSQMVWKPDQYIGRHFIYLYLLNADGDVDYDADPRSHLVVSVSYGFNDTLTDPGKTTPRTLRASSPITPDAPLEFVYPWDPNSGVKGEATISAFGVVNGKPVRSKTLALDMTNEAALVLASPTAITLATEGTLPEADRDGVGRLARQLLGSGMRPEIRGATGEIGRSQRLEETLRRRRREAIAHGSTGTEPISEVARRKHDDGSGAVRPGERLAGTIDKEIRSNGNSLVVVSKVTLDETGETVESVLLR